MKKPKVQQKTERRISAALRLVLAADDDWKTDGNPGVVKAREAAQAVGGVVSYPPSGGDWDDYRQAQEVAA